MPAGRFSPQETAYARRGIEQSLTEQEQREFKLNEALRLIKLHIDPEVTTKASFQDADLHKAIGLIVDVARYHGLLKR